MSIITINNFVICTIIIPVFNTGKYLRKCLDSVVNQTLRDIQIICVDDGSTDDSAAILSEYAKKDNRIVVINKQYGGQSSARNAAFPYITGKYIYFLDSDDWIEQDTLELSVSKMADEIDVVISGAFIDDMGGANSKRIKDLTDYYTAKLDGEFLIDDYLTLRVTSTVWGKLFKSSIIKKYGMVFLDGLCYEDNHFIFEYLFHCRKAYFLYKNLYHYVQRKNSIMNSVRSSTYKDFLYVFDHLYRKSAHFNLLDKFKKTLTRRYGDLLAQSCRICPSLDLPSLKELATSLAQSYDTDYFENDSVKFIKERQYHKVWQFNRCIIVVKSSSDEIPLLRNTVESFLKQSYRSLSVIVFLDCAVSLNKKFFSEHLDFFNENNVRVEYCENISESTIISVLLNNFPNDILILVKNGFSYPHYYLSQTISAYFERPDAFSSKPLDITSMVSLFSGFTIIAKDVTGHFQALNPKRVIVSMTSYPARISGVPQVLESIFAQTHKPDEIILWLARTEFPNGFSDLPDSLVNLIQKKQVSLYWCEDLKPHKKYFYAFKTYPDVLLITIDDDVLYPKDMIEHLYRSYLKHPGAVSAFRAHLMMMSETDEVLPYRLWPKEFDTFLSSPMMQLCPTGVSGILYPTVLFSPVKDLLDAELIKRCCLYTDDLWLKAMELIAGIPVVVPLKNRTIHYLPETQEVALWHKNLVEGENDHRLKLIIGEIDRRYGEGTFIRKLKEPSIGEDLIRREALCKLIRKVKTESKFLLSKYQTLRVDIRNGGRTGGNVIEQSVEPRPSRVVRPSWLPNGVSIESAAGEMKVILRCQGDGELDIRLRSRDERNTEGKRYPIWVDCTNFSVNGKVVFEEVKTICHDRPYVYRKPVRDSEVVELVFKWAECQSSTVLDGYRMLQSDLKQSQLNLKQLKQKLTVAEQKRQQLAIDMRICEKNLKKKERYISDIESQLKKFSIGKYMKYKILSKLTVGGMRHRYQEKYQEQKAVYQSITKGRF